MQESIHIFSGTIHALNIIKYETEYAKKNCMYSIPYSCGKVYKGVTFRSLDAQGNIEKHKLDARSENQLWLTVYGKKREPIYLYGMKSK